MGLFDIFGGGGSHSQTTQSTSNVKNTQLAGGNIGGNALYDSSGNVIVQTDQGAVAAGIQSATDIGQAALQLGSSATAAGDVVAIAGLDHARDAYTSSLALVGDVTTASLNGAYGLSGSAVDSVAKFAGTGLDAVSTFAGASLDRVARFSSSALDSNTYIAGKSLDSVAQAFSESLSSTNSANAKALGAVEDLAAQVSQSSQQTTDTTVQKIVWALVIGVIAIVALPKVLQ